MAKFESKQIEDIIDTLNGSIESIGSDSVDKERLMNLKRLGDVVYDLLLKIIQEYDYNKNAYEYSRIESRNECMQIMKDMYEMLGDYDFVHEEEE